MWKPLYTIGTVGSEYGEIIADEEYNNSCRITLEKCKKYYAITCGIYGSMVHTAFCDADEYKSKYAEMKKDLQNFIDSGMDNEDDFFDEFVFKY